MIACAPIAILRVAADGTIEFANTFAEALSLVPAPLVGQRWSAAFSATPGSDGDWDWLSLHPGREREIAYSRGETRRVVVWRLIAECAEGEPEPAFFAYGTEISAHKRVEDALAREKERAEEAEQLLAETQKRLIEAIETMPEGFVVYDADDRLLLCNSKYREIYAESADLLVPGARFEEVLREGARRGQYPQAIGREDAWLAERLAAHRAENQTLDQELPNGRWLRVVERRTADGGSVGVRVDITELKEREASFRLLFEGSPVPMWVYERETLRFLAVNDAAIKQYGFSREQFLAMTTADIRPADERARYRAFVDTSVRDIGKYGIWRHLKADGTEFLADIASHVIAFQDMRAALVVAFDVTDRVTAEGALRESEERLRQSETHLAKAQRIASLGSWEYDARADTLTWSDELYRIFDVPRESFTPTVAALMALVHPDDRDGLMASARAIMQGEVPAPLEGRIVRPDGTLRWVLREGHPVYDASGAVIGTFGTVQDITERKQVEEQLRRSEEHLARAQRIANIGSWEYDSATDELRWSAEMYRIFGVSPESFVLTRDNVLSLTHPDDRDRIVAAATRLVQNGEPEAFDSRIVRPDGSIRVIHRVGEARRDSSGRIVGRVGTAQDVTEVKRIEAERTRLEQQLFQSQKLEALGTLAGGIAHDLNNALVPVIMLSKLVLDELPEDSSQRESLDLIYQAGGRARDLVKQILAFSRREMPKKEAVDLGPFVEKSLALLRVTVPRTIELRTELQPVPLVMADPSQLFQLMINIVTNAAQAIGPSTGTITVSLDHDPLRHHALSGAAGCVRLTIGDTGAGLDKATLQRIFEPFFTTKKAGQGTGLGLAVVHGIVTSHGGYIEVDSVPGRGTTFAVILPPMPAAAQ